jgi:retinol dehydrogenase-12
MARVLAKRGAQVTIAARREDVLEDVKAKILSETPKARVDVLPLNLASLGSVREFADKWKQKDRPLNILM